MSHLHHSLKSKYCKKILNFVTVSKFSFLFNKIRIHNGSFSIKAHFYPLPPSWKNVKCEDDLLPHQTYIILSSLNIARKYSILEQFQNSHSYSTKLEYITVHLSSKPHFYPLPFSWKNVKCVDDFLPHQTYIFLSSLNFAKNIQFWNSFKILILIQQN